MSTSPAFSEKRDQEASAYLYPGRTLGGNATIGTCTYSSQVVTPVDSDTHKTTKIETTTALGRTEPIACLFPNSGSSSASNSYRPCSDSQVTESVRSKPTRPGTNANMTNRMSGYDYSPHGSNTETMSSMTSSRSTQADQLSKVDMLSTCSRPTGLRVNLPSTGSTNIDASELDLEKIPARALNVPTRTRLSLMLNPPKVLHNDWTGLAGEMGFEYEEIENFALERDPTKMVLSAWTCQQGSTIGVLLEMLRDINREDVLNDIQKLVERDASRWLERRRGDITGQPVQVPEVSGSYPNVPETPELRGITLEDHVSGPPEVFDAYVCFTDADREFVKEMMTVLEKEPYNLKLCIDFRDLVPGGSYSTITAELIENRCKRMIIVLSPDFLTSEDCNFQTKFAHSIAPSARSKRLIPVMVENCKPPNILRHLTICDYTKKDLRQWFWRRLYSALTKK
ncbi:myeloid differentiation primary response protein MyD88-like [Acanthaster planci]|uniref:Myeloid differentiation primary response protein MyD88-like n=1 Tax=Acanthaster planci TaxID=133434 RepID=A0A8B7XMH6_ACAPL|nr:myeloid differentiation primary response protein MyD88-like [Acanthaster planci]